MKLSIGVGSRLGFTAAQTIVSPGVSERLTSRTPWAMRPVIRTWSEGIRITRPVLVTTSMSSRSVTLRMATTDPVFGVTRAMRTPFPPRFWSRKTLLSTRLPNPCSVVTRRKSLSPTSSKLTTESSGARRIARTPRVARPVTRTSWQSNRIDIPFLVATTIRRSGWATSTRARRSPSSRTVAMRPPWRILAYSERLVRLKKPRAVPKRRRFSPSKERTGRIAATRSSGERERRERRCFPRAVRWASGSS